jgi:hypothetical protein
MGRSTTPFSPLSDSPLDVADEAFHAVCAGAHPLALFGSDFGPTLPARPIVLDELKTLLVDGDQPQSVSDAVWAEIVDRAHRDEQWRLGAIGMAIPALRKLAGKFARGYDGDVEELVAEILAGFLDRLSTVDTASPGIMLKLWWGAWRGGHGAILAHRKVQTTADEVSRAEGGPRAEGHPDLVLAGAVAAGAITVADADLIAETRIGGVGLAEYAAGLGVGYDTVKIRRQRAEARLVAHLTGAKRPNATFTEGRKARHVRAAAGRAAEVADICAGHSAGLRISGESGVGACSQNGASARFGDRKQSSNPSLGKAA